MFNLAKARPLSELRAPARAYVSAASGFFLGDMSTRKRAPQKIVLEKHSAPQAHKKIGPNIFFENFARRRRPKNGAIICLKAAGAEKKCGYCFSFKKSCPPQAPKKLDLDFSASKATFVLLQAQLKWTRTYSKVKFVAVQAQLLLYSLRPPGRRHPFGGDGRLRRQAVVLRSQ